jgi:ribosomal protein S18 acetylase RimI-like enzyme
VAITIKPLSPYLLEGYLTFFDNMVFTENPGWSACYCFSFHFTGTKDQWNKENNRASVIQYIQENKIKGYLAYSDDIPVGWCNANDRKNFESLSKYYKLTGNSGDKVCSIVCFTVNPEYRRRGIAQKLLEQICTDYTDLDYDYLEAYPGKGTLSCEQHYKGPLELYRQNGFRIEKEYKDYFVVRKRLR